MGHKDKKNETSFKEGNKAAEVWTKEAVKDFFDHALIIACENNVNYLGDIAVRLDTHKDIFNYLLGKFPEFRTIKARIDTIIESRLFSRALNNEVVASLAIFGLKNNHGWKDKTETDITSGGKVINQKTQVIFKDGRAEE